MFCILGLSILSQKTFVSVASFLGGRSPRKCVEILILQLQINCLEKTSNIVHHRNVILQCKNIADSIFGFGAQGCEYEMAGKRFKELIFLTPKIKTVSITACSSCTVNFSYSSHVHLLQ